MPTDTPDRRFRNGTLSDYGFALTLSVPFLLLFLATQASTMSPAHDSMCYLRMIEQGEFFHEHHLLYNAVAWLWTEAWQLLFPGLGAITLISWLNGVFGAMTLAVFALILLRRAGLSRVHTAIATLLPAFSFGIWFYSITIEVYIIALFFLLAAMYVLSREALDTRAVVLAALLHGVAMLFHQLHLFFLLPALFMIVQNRRRAGVGGVSVWRASLLYTGTAGLTALLPYVYIGWFVLGMDTPERYFHWLIGYGARGDFWSAPGLSLIPKIALGYGRSIVGADFLFALQPTLELVQRLLPSKWLADQEFVVRHLPEWLAILLVALSVVFTTAFTFVLGKGIVRAWRDRLQLPTVFRSAFVLLLIYGLFFAFWDTTNVEFWIPQSVMIWLLLAIALLRVGSDSKDNAASQREVPDLASTQTSPFAEAPGSVQAATTVPASARTHPRIASPALFLTLAGLLFILNGAGSIFWMIPSSNDYYMSKSRDLVSLAGKDGLILLPDFYMMDWYLPLEASRDARAFTHALKHCDRDVGCALETVSRSMDSAFARGGRIVLDGHLVHPTTAVEIRGGTGYRELVEAFISRYSAYMVEHPAVTGSNYIINAIPLHGRDNP